MVPHWREGRREREKIIYYWTLPELPVEWGVVMGLLAACGPPVYGQNISPSWNRVLPSFLETLLAGSWTLPHPGLFRQLCDKMT